MHNRPPARTAEVKLLVFDDELLSRTRSGTVWGRVYFEFDHQFFPGEGWSDLAVAFVVPWLEAITRIATAASKTEIVDFMDGPASVAISTIAQGSIKLDFLHRAIVRHSVVASVRQVLRSAITAAEELVAICNHHGWSGDPDYLRLITDVDKAIKPLPV